MRVGTGKVVVVVVVDEGTRGGKWGGLCLWG